MGVQTFLTRSCASSVIAASCLNITCTTMVTRAANLRQHNHQSSMCCSDVQAGWHGPPSWHTCEMSPPSRCLRAMPKTSAASTSTGDALAPEEMRRTCGVDSSSTSVRSRCYIDFEPGAKTLGTLYVAHFLVSKAVTYGMPFAFQVLIGCGQATLA